jgi:hypothetical protein
MISIHNYLNVEKSIGMEEQNADVIIIIPFVFSFFSGQSSRFFIISFFSSSRAVYVYIWKTKQVFMFLSLVVSTVFPSFAHLSKQSHISSLCPFFCVDCYSIFLFLSLSISADLCAIYCIYIYKYEESKIHDDVEIEPKRRSLMKYLNSFFNYYIMCFSVHVFCVCVYMYANL